jgi:N-acetyl-alpha-D-muramate 1-phosphate uridylyltransferase
LEKLTKALILAAGFGSRLMPLTNDTPKALLKINGKTLLEHVIGKLINSGIEEFIVNVHHHRSKMLDYLSRNDFGKKISVSEENEILGTGGGIKNTAGFFADCKSFLVYNVDVISELDIGELFEFHMKFHPTATLAIQKRDTTRPLIFDSENLLVGRMQTGTEKKYKNPSGKTFLAGFCGIHIISHEIFNNFQETGTFDIFTTYFRLAEGNKKILGYDIGDCSWRDVGTLNDFNSFSSE